MAGAAAAGEKASQRGEGSALNNDGESERLHVLTGEACNNNCIFCMEEDRGARQQINSRTTDEVIQWLLKGPPREEICFTSGEPTLNPRLPTWVHWSKLAGVPRISVMTNGRKLAYARYAQMLVKAGMNRFYVSIHGHEAKLHESLTRTPDSFVQTVDGIRQITKLKRFGVDLHTSTVITRRNLPFLAEIYTFLRGLGVDQVVFNVMQANGRANTHFDKIFPTYTDIAETMKQFLDGEPEAEVMAFLVDIPLCKTESLPDFNRGYVEKYVHFEAPLGGHDVDLPVETEGPKCGPGGDLVAIRRSDLDGAVREKREECGECKHTSQCPGVWKNYLRRYGWDEFSPIKR